MLIWYADLPKRHSGLCDENERNLVIFFNRTDIFPFLIPFIILLPRSSKVNGTSTKMAIWIILLIFMIYTGSSFHISKKDLYSDGGKLDL